MINLEDVKSAARRVSPYVIETPLERSQTLSHLLGTNAYLKMELFQKTGSFKPRGAFNQILQLDEQARAKGVVAVSGGNFAQGVAYAASQLGIKAVICMPEYTPSNYVEATKSYGATVELSPDFPSTFAKAETFKSEGYAFLHAWDNPNQMAGNGTIGLEILERLPDVTDIVISIGGGGLIAGITVAVKAIKPDVRIWGVETEGAQTMGKALEAGKVVQITPNSLAKTLSATYVAEDALRDCTTTFGAVCCCVRSRGHRIRNDFYSNAPRCSLNWQLLALYPPPRKLAVVFRNRVMLCCYSAEEMNPYRI